SMFLTFLVDRCEQGVLEAVDGYADRQLAHRFQRAVLKSDEFADVVRQQTQVLVQATEELVQRQAAVWAQALDETSRRQAAVEAQAQQRLTASLEAALERTLEAHAQRLDGLNKQAVEQTGELADRLAKLAATVRDTGREQQAALTRVAQAV